MGRDNKDARVTRNAERGTPIKIGFGHHKIPDAFRAFCIIVSFTAANTSRIFVVSVACVRLKAPSQITDGTKRKTGKGRECVLRVNAEPGSICLHELQ